MKQKIFGSLALTAVLGLGALSGVPVYADAPDCSAVTSKSKLVTCIDADQPITLAGDIDTTEVIVIRGGKTPRIDLSGHKIQYTGENYAFEIRQGSLEFTGSGVVSRIGSPSAADSHSTLEIHGSADPVTSPSSSLVIGSDVTVSNTDAAAVLVKGTDRHGVSSEYGIRVDIFGDLLAPQGVAVDASLTTVENAPLINIHDGASITASDQAVAALGFANWNFGRAIVTAGTGIAFVGGNFYFENTAVTATAEDNSAIYPNGPIVTMPSTGAALQIQAKKGITDKSTVYIRSGSFTSSLGYAIAEYAADMFSSATSLKDFKIYTGELHGSSTIGGGSLISTTTGAFGEFFSDGRMMEIGSYSYDETDQDVNDTTSMIVRRFGEVSGLAALYENERFSDYSYFFPAFSRLIGLEESAAEALAESDMKDSHILDVYDLSIYAFLDEEPTPVPGMTPIHDYITNTGADTPLSFTIPFPAIDDMKDGYTRTFYVLNFHSDPRTGEYEITKIPAKLSSDGTYTFKTHRFSTFALAYSEEKIPVVPDSGKPALFASPIAVRLSLR